MNLFNDVSVKKYIESLDGASPYEHVITFCQCIEKNFPENVHNENNAEPMSSNMAELASSREQNFVRQVGLYLTNTCYFNAETMKYLVSEMLKCEDTKTVEQFYGSLYLNFRKHPPCARYINREYEELMIKPYKKCFGEMNLWEYIVKTFNLLTIGSLVPGENMVFDLAFKKCLNFCLMILHFDYDMSIKTNNPRPLIMKCLNFNPERRTRLSDITKLLDMVFNTGYNLQPLVVNLALLINKIK